MDGTAMRVARIAGLTLMGVGLATSAWAVPIEMLDLAHPTATHGLLATAGLLGLVFGGRTRSERARR